MCGNICNGSKILENEKKNMLQCAYKDVEILIIDEISLCGAHMLWAVSNTLQQIFENTLPFGGIKFIIVVGDFNQCSPVHDSYCFEAPNEPASKIAGPQLWNKFQIYELTEIMRQKDDLKFAQALNNLAVGATTEDDDNLFRSREMSSLNVVLCDIISTVTALYYPNVEVDAHNTMYLALATGQKSISMGLDVCNGPGNQKQRDYMLKRAQDMHHKQTQNLQKYLKLVIGARYNITQNIAVSDGIANGTSCTLQKVIMGKTNNDQLIAIRVYVLFENEEAGQMTRSNKRDLMRKDNADLSWTPIERISRTFTVTKGSLLTVTRNQIPLTAAAASTIHSAQSTTKKEVMVSVNGLPRKLLYTGLSRATTANGLYIAGTYKKPAKATMLNDKPMAEMQRMRVEAPLKFDLLFPEDYKTSDNLLCIFHNVRSLNLHFEDVCSSKSFTSSDIIMLAETWTLPVDQYILDGFSIVHRTDCTTVNRQAFGTLILLKTQLLAYSFIFYEKQLILSHAHITVVAISVANEAIIFVYKSPQGTFANLQSMLEEAFYESSKLNLNQINVIGDFNIKYQASDMNYTALKTFMTSNHYFFSLNENDVTTDHDSLIDLCFSSNKKFHANIFESVTSDHKPIWFLLTRMFI